VARFQSSPHFYAYLRTGCDSNLVLSICPTWDTPLTKLRKYMRVFWAQSRPV
jgi:hypothetical protein